MKNTWKKHWIAEAIWRDYQDYKFKLLFDVWSKKTLQKYLEIYNNENK